MAKVRDPHGARWSVYRRWVGWYWEVSDESDWNWSGSRSGAFIDADIFINWLQIVVVWPFWFGARWLGLPWTIVIERNGTKVGEERVCGWRKSQRRIQEITESAAAGTLPVSEEMKARRSAPAAGGCLTPDDVHNMAFSSPASGKRGYNEDEVDAFLDRVEAALRDPTGRTLTPELVRNVAFAKPPLGKRGYDRGEVDAFLGVVEEEIRSRRTRERHI